MPQIRCVIIFLFWYHASVNLQGIHKTVEENEWHQLNRELPTQLVYVISLNKQV